MHNIVYNKYMPKYDSLRKVERNAALQEYAQNHSDFSMKEIGNVFGISGPRVWVILKKIKKVKNSSGKLKPKLR